MERREENDLIERAKRGDEAAWSALWEQFKNLVWQLAIKNSARGFDLDDSVAIASREFMCAVRAFDPSRGCRLITIIVPRIRWNLDRAFRGGPVHVPYTVRARPPASVPIEPQFRIVPSADEPLIEREERAQLAAALELLPDRQRAILAMRMQGATFRQIADQFRFSRERARQLVDRSIEELRRLCGVA